MILGPLSFWVLSTAVGFARPAYCSFKALKTSSQDDDTQWLTYWIVYAVFNAIAQPLDLVMAWLPFYFEAKLFFLWWLQSPQFQVGLPSRPTTRKGVGGAIGLARLMEKGRGAVWRVLGAGAREKGEGGFCVPQAVTVRASSAQGATWLFRAKIEPFLDANQGKIDAAVSEALEKAKSFRLDDIKPMVELTVKKANELAAGVQKAADAAKADVASADAKEVKYPKPASKGEETAETDKDK